MSVSASDITDILERKTSVTQGRKHAGSFGECPDSMLRSKLSPDLTPPCTWTIPLARGQQGHHQV